MQIKKILVLLVVLVCLGALISCDMVSEFIESRMRPIPLIQIYNSNLEKTLKMVPNDTLYVQVQGLQPDSEYIVQCLDPTDNVITEIMVNSDEHGVIGMTPLWYDIGFRVEETTNRLVLEEAAITLKAFHIRVKDAESAEENDNSELGIRSLENAKGTTDFRLPFFFVSSTDNLERPQPVVIAGKLRNSLFEMENAFYSDQVVPENVVYPDDYEGTPLTNKLYINVEQMTPLTEGAEGYNKTVRIWILPFMGEPYRDGERITDTALFYKEFTVDELMSADEGILMPWPQTLPVSTIDVGDSGASVQDEIPQWAEGGAYSVFLDMMDNGIPGFYNIMQEGFDSFYLDSIDGNGVPGFIVKEPPAAEADYVPLQLASGGMFRYNYTTRQYDYDYRNTFRRSGYDTKYSSHSGAFWGYGIKVIWNPYLTPAGWQASGAVMPSRFWGSYVDVYIVDANHVLADGTTITSATGTSRKRLTVQYGCSNGYWQQTVWRAPMTVGTYMMIVDMDLSGTITADDLIDNVRTDTGTGGFSVID